MATEIVTNTGACPILSPPMVPDAKTGALIAHAVIEFPMPRRETSESPFIPIPVEVDSALLKELRRVSTFDAFFKSGELLVNAKTGEAQRLHLAQSENPKLKSGRAGRSQDRLGPGNKAKLGVKPGEMPPTYQTEG
jgi:hypothetical protein